jgi:hypothetical protein
MQETLRYDFVTPLGEVCNLRIKVYEDDATPVWIVVSGLTDEGVSEQVRDEIVPTLYSDLQQPKQGMVFIEKYPQKMVKYCYEQNDEETIREISEGDISKRTFLGIIQKQSEQSDQSTKRGLMKKIPLLDDIATPL